ncbi:MAG: GWxTD domain-containing protein [Acidobacteriota bacterium]
MKVRLILAAGLLLASLGTSCRLAELRRKLPPPYADFLLRVRYIITSEEEKIFLELPDAEKDAFIEEFWSRRDPNPDSEENEFKLEYFDRLEKANQLFRGEGKDGWLTDRGRIYILLGPPLDRITEPLGSRSSGVCSEVWYYGSFPVVFRDFNCSGHYELVTYDLTSLRDVNLQYMQELNLAQAQAHQTFSQRKKLFDFSLEVRKNIVEPGKVEGLFSLKVPYVSIWFRAEDGRLKTELEIQLELADPTGTVSWQHKDRIEISLREEEIKDKRDESYLVEIPFLITDRADSLRGGRNTLRARVKNLTGNEEMSKAIPVEF